MLLYQDQQRNLGVRVGWWITSSSSDKELDGTLKIGYSIRSNNNERLAWKKNLAEPLRSDTWDGPIITSSSRGKRTWRNPQDRILNTVNESRVFSQIKQIKESARSDPSRWSTSNIAKDKPYTYAKAVNAHKNPYTYAKSAQLAKHTSHIHTKKPHNVRKSRTQTYTKAVYKRTKKP